MLFQTNVPKILNNIANLFDDKDRSFAEYDNYTTLGLYLEIHPDIISDVGKSYDHSGKATFSLLCDFWEAAPQTNRRKWCDIRYALREAGKGNEASELGIDRLCDGQPFEEGAGVSMDLKELVKECLIGAVCKF